MTKSSFDGLDALFAPRSIAVIGASSSPAKIGGLPIHFLKSHGFAGDIYPVNPKADEIQGFKSYGDIREIPGDVDLAVCAVPGAFAEPALIAAAERGVRAVLMFTAGFAELGEEGAARQSRLSEIARSAGMRLAGPNCMGMANLQTGAVATFHPAFATKAGTASRIGLVSQSGAFGGFCMSMANDRGLPLGHMITTGNEADVEVADGLMFLARQSHVDVVMLYIEGVRDGPRFLEALGAARGAGKIVVAIKLGSTDIGGQAAASHTAALAGADEVYDAIFRQYGVYRTHSIEEFFDVGCAAAVGGLPANEKVGLVTVSGGVGILMADDAAKRGLSMPELTPQTQAAVKELVPFAGTRNPLDITGQVINDMSLMNKSMDLIVEDSDMGSIVLFAGSSARQPTSIRDVIEPFIEIAKRHKDKWIAFSGLSTPEARKLMDANGVPSFAEPTHATRAIAALSRIARSNERMADESVAAPPDTTLAAREFPPQANEIEALAALKSAGVRVVEAERVETGQAAADAAERLGFPVALKILSPDLQHKSDIGGVRLNLADAAAVESAFSEIAAAVVRHAPDARVDGCLLAPMISGGVETILGVTRDPVFGPVVMFGLGGVLVEALGDVSFRVAPIGTAEAHRMISETRGAILLDGFRGAPPADRDALARALSDLSRFAAANADTLESLEANPFLVRPKGQGAIALDAVLSGRNAQASDGKG